MCLALKYVRSVKLIPVFIVFLIYPALCVYAQTVENEKHDVLLDLLPSGSQLKEWKLDGEPQIAVGKELYLAINGGAEIYMQAGFNRAILASYNNGNGKGINLEIYEMTSPESAKSIHLGKTGNQGEKLPIGDEAVLESYYINVRKGSFQITLSGYDSEKETVAMLLDFAHIVANNIQALR